MCRFEVVEYSVSETASMWSREAPLSQGSLPSEADAVAAAEAAAEVAEDGGGGVGGGGGGRVVVGGGGGVAVVVPRLNLHSAGVDADVELGLQSPLPPRVQLKGSARPLAAPAAPAVSGLAPALAAAAAAATAAAADLFAHKPRSVAASGVSVPTLRGMSSITMTPRLQSGCSEEAESVTKGSDPCLRSHGQTPDPPSGRGHEERRGSVHGQAIGVPPIALAVDPTVAVAIARSEALQVRLI